MKLSKIMLAIAALGLVSVANAAPESQGGGTVTFTGSIVKAPCSIDSESEHQLVVLGPIGNKVLENGGQSLPKPFKIKLVSCDVSDLVDKTVTSTFTGTSSTGNPDMFALTGDTQGASLAIVYGSNNLVKPGVAHTPLIINNGENTLNYAAYVKGDMVKDASGGPDTGATIVTGTFTTITNYTLAYQ